MQTGSSPHRREGALRWFARGAAIVALYAAIAVWFTWPLAASLRTHLPDTWVGCRTDALVSAWIFSHDSRAFLSNPLRVGDRIRVVPAHIDPTIAYHECMHVVSGEDVVETWPVDLRGW